MKLLRKGAFEMKELFYLNSCNRIKFDKNVRYQCFEVELCSTSEKSCHHFKPFSTHTLLYFFSRLNSMPVRLILL